MSNEMQTKVQVSPVQNFTPVQTGLLQKKSALCNTPGLVEDSGEDKEKLTLQHSSADQAGTTTVPRFGHDFSRVSVHSNGPGMIQAKLKINEPGDIYEQKADRVAEQVMRMEEPRMQRQPEEELVQKKPVITPLVQRQALLAAPFTEQHAALLGGKKLSGHASQSQVPTTLFSLQRQQGNALVQKVVERLQNSAAKHEPDKTSLENLVEELQQQKGSGQPIGDETRKEMEQALGYDLGEVRLYTDSLAHKGADALGAKAFTMDTDIFFSQKHGNDFSSPEGKRLLTHELTHVVQQSQGNPALPGDKVKIGEMGDAYENEADAVANRVVRGVGTARTSAMPIRAQVPSQVQPQYLSEEKVPERREELPLKRPDTAGRIIQKENGDVIPLEPMVISASAQDVEARVNAHEDTINGQIQTMVNEGITPLTVGINTAVQSFENWWVGQSHPTSDTAFWCDVTGAAIAIGLAVMSVVAAAAAPVTIAAAILFAESLVVRGDISRSAALREDQARAYFSQCALNAGVEIRRRYQTFGDTLKNGVAIGGEHIPAESNLWWDIAIALTAEPPETAWAREMLHAEAGIPRSDRPYAELTLTQMIHEYRVYRARRRLGEVFALEVAEIVISEESIARIASQAESEARGQLGVESAR